MGTCSFCGKPAGFMKKSHSECKQKHEDGKRKIVSFVKNAASNKTDFGKLKNQIKAIASSSFVTKPDIRNLVLSGWEQAVESAFDDGVLTQEEEDALTEVKDHFSLSQEEIDRNGALRKLVKGAILREILDGVIPDRIKVEGNIPFNFQKSEKLVWLFQDVKYFEQKRHTRYVGGSQGFSVRIARGLYYRTGAFKGQRVETNETVHADTGMLGVTNKHLYFAGSVKRFRVRFDKIVAFEPYSDGIGIQKDAASAKPQSFATGDGWFTYNLITNLAKI